VICGLTGVGAVAVVLVAAVAVCVSEGRLVVRIPNRLRLAFRFLRQRPPIQRRDVDMSCGLRPLVESDQRCADGAFGGFRPVRVRREPGSHIIGRNRPWVR